jgi:hypothetical protein
MRARAGPVMPGGLAVSLRASPRAADDAAHNRR